MHTQESLLTGDESKHHKNKLMQMEINFALGKNVGNKCNGLDGRLIAVARHAVSEWHEILAI